MPAAQQLPFGVQTPPGTHPPHTWWGGDLGHFREPRREIDKVSNFGDLKNGPQNWVYTGHIPGISGWRSRDQAYTWHVAGSKRGVNGHIPGICAAYTKHMRIYRVYARYMPRGIYPEYAH